MAGAEGLTGALPLEALPALRLGKMNKAQQSFILQAISNQVGKAGSLVGQVSAVALGKFTVRECSLLLTSFSTSLLRRLLLMHAVPMCYLLLRYDLQQAQRSAAPCGLLVVTVSESDCDSRLLLSC
jgi:hypothetical protein